MKLTAGLDDKSIIIIAGPTASGKTDTAIALADAINGEIISADSRQVYRFLDIGTAKPTPSQRLHIPHHLIDILNPEECFDAGQFTKQAESAVRDITSRKKQPIIVGGTGLYIKAFMDGLTPLPSRNTDIRKKLEERISAEGVEALYLDLKKKDPATASRIDRRNPRRIIRALEVLQLTGKSIAELHKNTRYSPYRFIFFSFFLHKDILMKRIILRTKQMLEHGMIDETKNLLAKGWPPESPAFTSLGYRHVIHYLNGKKDLTSVEESLITDTWQYAKRQKTWFNKDKRIFPLGEDNPLKIIENTLKKHTRT